MRAPLRAGALAFAVLLLAAAWPLYRGPAMGVMLSTLAFCQ